MERTVMVAVALSATLARADVVTWFWTVSDTGNGDGLIEPGESALLTLSMAFDPPQPQLGGMFAQAGPYDILGNAAWAAGAVDARENYLDDASDSGTLDGFNNILAIDNFQYALMFDVDYDDSNPIDLFFIRWTPEGYQPATVTLNNGGPDTWIYTDQFGNWLLYGGEGG
jgi:hypothetical protein